MSESFRRLIYFVFWDGSPDRSFALLAIFRFRNIEMRGPKLASTREITQTPSRGCNWTLTGWDNRSFFRSVRHRHFIVLDLFSAFLFLFSFFDRAPNSSRNVRLGARTARCDRIARTIKQELCVLALLPFIVDEKNDDGSEHFGAHIHNRIFGVDFFFWSRLCKHTHTHSRSQQWCWWTSGVFDECERVCSKFLRWVHCQSWVFKLLAVPLKRIHAFTRIKPTLFSSTAMKLLSAQLMCSRRDNVELCLCLRSRNTQWNCFALAAAKIEFQTIEKIRH